MSLPNSNHTEDPFANSTNGHNPEGQISLEDLITDQKVETIADIAVESEPKLPLQELPITLSEQEVIKNGAKLSSPVESKNLLSKKAQRIFKTEQKIPNQIKEDLDEVVGVLVEEILRIEADLKEDPELKSKDGKFLGFDNPKVVKKYYSHFGQTVSNPKYLGMMEAKFKALKKLVFPDILNDCKKPYMDTQTLNDLKRHALMNRLACLGGTFSSPEIGEGFLNQALELAKMRGANAVIPSFAATFGVFGLITKFNDWALESFDLSKKRNAIVKLSALSGLMGCKAVLISASMAGGFVHLEPLDLQNYSNRASQEILQDLKEKSISDQESLDLLNRQKVLLKNANPNDAQKKELTEISAKLKVHIPSKEILEISTSQSLTQKETDEDIKRIQRELDTKNTVAPAVERYNKAVTDITTKSPGEFVKDNIGTTLDKQHRDSYLKILQETDPHMLSLYDKWQVATDKLKFEQKHDKVLSIFVNSAAAFIPELLSIATLVLVISKKRYREHYSNADFQDKYNQLMIQVSSLVHKHAKSENSKLVLHLTTTELIKKLGKTGDHHLLNTQDLIAWYTERMLANVKHDNAVSLAALSIGDKAKSPWKDRIGKNKSDIKDNDE